MNRSIRFLYMALAAGFGLLVLMLGYWQVVVAGELVERADNPYQLQKQRLVNRGRIISADKVVLAESVMYREKGTKYYRRYYPQGSLAAQVVGYATPEQGSTGLEQQYNRYLAGSYGTGAILDRLREEQKDGADIRLTLDTRVQKSAEALLAGRRGAVVAIEPRTGKVLALASSPAFDLNEVLTDFASIRKKGGAPLLNRSTAGLYPPGSTFKVVTATAALNGGKWSASSTFDDKGVYVADSRPIFNSGKTKFGLHNLTDALTFSINTTFAKIGDQIGPRALGAEMTRFGFGRPTEIDLPGGEVAVSGRYRKGALLPNGRRNDDSARIAIGQENLQVTPLQMAMVAGAIANGGRMQRPYLMRRAITRDGVVVKQQRPEEVDSVSSAYIASEVGRMMQSVVSEGTGTQAGLSGLSVAGKTGTAETGDPDRNQAWFIGYAPAVNPKVAVAVVIEDTSGTGGTQAAPVAGEVMRTALSIGPVQGDPAP
ncbi:MAG: penicillin-binding transpeptidase domain-containing protein [Thermoleophilia bacterium]|jgi:penicillin-binding protein A|nr:penicillin-binding transpeptidase domain-containing protein [Thermoleophilia bacterium]